MLKVHKWKRKAPRCVTDSEFKVIFEVCLDFEVATVRGIWEEKVLALNLGFFKWCSHTESSLNWNGIPIVEGIYD